MNLYLYLFLNKVKINFKINNDNKLKNIITNKPIKLKAP